MRQRRHLGGMPLQACQARAFSTEERVALAFGRELDFADADLGLPRHRRNLAAEGYREQLMAEADAEIGYFARDDRLPDRSLLRDQPREAVLLPNVLRSAHHDEGRVTRERRNRFPRVEPHNIPGDAVGREKVAEGPGVLEGMVLEDEDAGHGGFLFRVSRVIDATTKSLIDAAIQAPAPRPPRSRDRP